MDGKVVTPNQSSQTSGRPMGPICILLVDDDAICLTIISGILKTWKYEVVTVKHAMEALCTLRVMGDAFDLVITDVHMPDMNGFELQKKIDEEFNLPVVFMSADDKESVILRGLQSGAAFFLVKPISPNDLKNLWQYAVAKKKTKSANNEAIKSTPGTSQASFSSNVFLYPTASSTHSFAPFSNDPNHFLMQETSENEKGSNEVKSDSSLRNEDKKNTKDSRRKYPANVEEGENTDDSGNMKKRKVIWTNALHNLFLEAIRCVGLERAVPKKILELMNVPGLTRENIASHLQKYRNFLKRVSEASNKIESASERTTVERTFRSNFAMAQPHLLHKKPKFQYLRNLDRAAPLGKSLQPNLSFSNQKFASSTTTNSPVPLMFGSGQSHLLLNQTSTFKQPLMVGIANPPFYHQANSAAFRMEQRNNNPTGLLLNGNGNISGGIMNIGNRNGTALEFCTNDFITRFGNNGGFRSSNLSPSTPNYENNSGYVGFRLDSDGQLLGLSADLNIPEHGSNNVVQSESTSNNVPVMNGSTFGDYVAPILDNVVQDENTLAKPLSPSILLDNALGNEGESDYIFGPLLDNQICEVDSNHNFLQPDREYGFNVPSEINFIQPPIQDDVEVLNSALSFGPDDHHVQNSNPIANNGQFLEQPLGSEMTFSDFGIDGGNEYLPVFEQTFDHQFHKLEDDDLLEPALFGTSNFYRYDKL